MTDTSSVVDDYLRGQKNFAVQTANDVGPDDDPQRAADSMRLEKGTGIPSTQIYHDYDHNLEQFRAGLRGDIISGSPTLQDYINSHPLNSKVSLDDIGNLKDSEQSIKQLHNFSQRGWGRIMAAGVARSLRDNSATTMEGLGYLIGAPNLSDMGARLKLGTDQEVPATPEEQKTFSYQAGQVIGGLVLNLSAMFAGGITGAAAQAGLQGGEEQRQAAVRAGQDGGAAFALGGATSAAMTALPLHYFIKPAQAVTPGFTGYAKAKAAHALKSGLAMGVVGEAGEAANQWIAHGLYDDSATYTPSFERMVTNVVLGTFMGGAFSKVKPYTDAGAQPPVGVDPRTDAIHAQMAQHDIFLLDNAMDTAQKSNTHTISPESYRKFARLVTDGDVFVSSDAVRALYGDKTPAQGDGLLGNVLDIANQLELTQGTGAYLRIPMADWLAHVDPEVHKQLRDHVTIRPAGMTMEEVRVYEEDQAKEEQEQKELQEGVPGETKVAAAGTTGAGFTAPTFGAHIEPAPRASRPAEPKPGEPRVLPPEERAVTPSETSEQEGLTPIQATAQRINQLIDRVGAPEVANLYRVQYAAAMRSSDPPTALGRLEQTLREQVEPETTPYVQQPYDDLQVELDNLLEEMRDELPDEGIPWPEAPPEPVEPPPVPPEDDELVRMLDEIQAAITGGRPYAPVGHTIDEWSRIARDEDYFNAAEAARNYSVMHGESHMHFFDGAIARIYRDGRALEGEDLQQAIRRAEQEGWRRLPVETHNLDDWQQFAEDAGVPGAPFYSAQAAATAYSEHNNAIAHISYVSTGNRYMSFMRGDRIEADHPAISTFNRTPRGGLESVARTTDDAVDSTRRASGLNRLTEPYTGKVSIEPTHRGISMHGFNIIGEQGEKLGDITISYRNGDVHVNGIRLNGYTYGDSRAYNLLGTRNSLRIAKELKKAFPDSTSISGYRVGGARQRAGAIGNARIKFEKPEDALDILRDMTEVRDTGVDHTTGDWVDLRRGYRIKPLDPYNKNEERINKMVTRIFKKIAPKGLQFLGAKQVTREGATFRQAGAYFQRADAMPYVLWATDGGREGDKVYGPFSTVRHEILHHLRSYGFFDDHEWAALRDAAVKGRWIFKHNIHNRYRGEGLGTMLEEAIADEFGFRIENGLSSKSTPENPTMLDRAWQKLHQMREGIRLAWRRMTGKEMDFRDIFQKIERGEIGRRRGREPLWERAYTDEKEAPSRPIEGRSLVADVNARLDRLKPLESRPAGPKQPELPGMTRMEDRSLFEEGKAIGLPKKVYTQLQEAMDKRDAEDVEFANKQLLKDITRRQGTEWKAQEKAHRAEIEPQIENRPDIAAERFLSKGILHDQKIQGRPRLDSNYLTDEQKAVLPKDFHTPGGVHPDDVARLFGFHTGGRLIEDVTRLLMDRGNQGPRQYINKLVDQAVEQRMQAEHGDLAQNILDEAKDHVLSQTEFNKIHEETLREATRMGMEMPLTKENMQQIAEHSFGQQIAAKLSLDSFFRDMYRASDKTIRSLIGREPTEAFRQLQRRMMTFLHAREMKVLEKEQKAFERAVKRLQSRQLDNVDQTHTNWARFILLKIGRLPGSQERDLLETIARDRAGHKSLEEFVNSVNNGPIQKIPMPVAEFLFDPSFTKKFDDLTVDEFRGVHNSIKTILHVGRDLEKLDRAGEKIDFHAGMDQLVAGMQRLGIVPYTPDVPPSKFMGLIRKGFIAHLQLESLLNRFDLGNPRGAFNQLIVRSYTEAINFAEKLQREFGQKLGQLTKIDEINKLVDNPFFENPQNWEEDPETRKKIPSSGNPQRLMRLSRRNVLAILNNVGNPGNFFAMLDGHGIPREKADEFMRWLFSVTTRKDWERSQQIGRILEEAKSKYSDPMYENLSGIAPENIETWEINTPWGPMRGWYYPIIRDRAMPQNSEKLRGWNMLEHPSYIRPTPASNYTKSRTGYVGPLQLNLDGLPGRLNEILYDAATRPSIVQLSKIFGHERFMTAMGKHVGQDYVSMLKPFMRDFAGAGDHGGDIQHAFTQAVTFFRQNIANHMVGLNPMTIVKHNVSGLALSINQIGLPNFIAAHNSLWRWMPGGGRLNEDMSNWRFADLWSEELQRRHQNVVDTVSGQYEHTFGALASKLNYAEFKAAFSGRTTREGAQLALGDMKAKYMSLREMMMYAEAAPLAILDKYISTVTWIGAYKKAMQDGQTHGQAIFEGNRAVRMSHGSTAITNRPQMLRGGAFMQTFTQFMGFFNTMTQRQYDLAWMMKEMRKKDKGGIYTGGGGQLPPPNVIDLQKVREGEYSYRNDENYKTGLKMIPVMAGILVASTIIPTMVHQWVDPPKGGDEDNEYWKWGKALLANQASGIPFVREIVHAFEGGGDISAGLFGSLGRYLMTAGRKTTKGHFATREEQQRYMLDANSVFSSLTGLSNNSVPKWGIFGYNTYNGHDDPQNLREYWRSITTGFPEERRRR